MEIQNQNYTNQQSGNPQIHFVPLSSKVSYLGTTVNYGMTGTGNVNAFSSPNISSGNYISAQQPLWNTGYGYIGSGITNAYPYISASQFGQTGSCVFDFNSNNIHKRTLLVQPTVDISETSSDIVISAFVSNSAVNNMNLSVTPDSCTISGSVWTGAENLTLHRTIPLSTSIRAEAVDATLKSGVLEIRLPKTEKMNRNKTTVSQDIAQTNI
ncbi:MAG TPA: Hsp20/alpha crystallin family protein [Bacillota bacterium]|nr:Hsp20/alpha crystallin family protein [Bacillota bacterium]